MANLSVKHTVDPNGHVTKYLFGMPKPETKCMASVMKLAVMNTVRPGGICHIEGQQSALETAKEILTTKSK